MLKIKTLKKLEQLMGFEVMIDVVGIQAILHTTEPTSKDILKSGIFSKRIVNKFNNLCCCSGGEETLRILLICSEYEDRLELKGPGGCVAKRLSTLLKPYIEKKNAIRY